MTSLLSEFLLWVLMICLGLAALTAFLRGQLSGAV